VSAEVVELRPEETHALRLGVLRNGTPSDEVVFDGDELDTTFHLGVRIDGDLAAISTWLERPYPDRPGDRGFQLRGMATDVARRGEGLGTQVLEAGIERCRTAGAVLVWARARDTALPFYLHHGFRSVGLGYVDLTTGLPHHDVIREIS
jgi:predicted GNAT family N-acyltransferase